MRDPGLRGYLPDEGEDLQVVSTNGPRPEPVDMLNEGPDWSGGKQLLQQAGEAGASFTAILPPVESDGWHDLTIRWTTGPECGRARLRSNCPHNLRDVECYTPVRGAKEVPVGAVKRQLGDNAQLTVEVIGKDTAATSAWIGLDWLAQKPTAQPVGDIQTRLAGTEKASWQPCPKVPPPTPEQVAESRKRFRESPPAEAVAPAAGFGKAGVFLLRATLHAPTNGLYRLDWRGNAPPPPTVKVNGKECALDPRRFSSPAQSAEKPRRSYIMLNVGDNEVVWRGLYAPGQWMAPVLMGVEPPEGGRLSGNKKAADACSLEIWHGDVQRVGHVGDVQDDFNLMGRVRPWQEVDTLSWRLRNNADTPLSFQAFRRLVEDGDFNADTSIGSLNPGPNHITLTARFKDGRTISRTATVIKESGSRPLPVRIRWKEVKNPQDVGQFVDGMWGLDEIGLRTRQIGYGRVFLIGERGWKDYEVRTTITVHEVTRDTSPRSGGNGVGVILRFTGHVTGGPRGFAPGQPKWGYQPFGAIGWLRWKKSEPEAAPQTQFFRGDSDRSKNRGEFPFRLRETYAVRFRCDTLPDDAEGRGVTRCSFKIWKAADPEPEGTLHDLWLKVAALEDAQGKLGVVVTCDLLGIPKAMYERTFAAIHKQTGLDRS